MEHRELREQLGAYALGALDPSARQALDRHLADCASCRDELGMLSSLRPLLDQIDESDLDLVAARVDDPDVMTTRLARARAREHRVLRTWQATAIAAGIALVVTVGVTRPKAGIPSEPLTIGQVTVQAAAAHGDASATPWEWGTTVSLELVSLPHLDGYVVWVVAKDGHREQAGTWGPTATGKAVVRGASGILTDEIERIEVTDLDGNLLLAFLPQRPTA